MRLVSQTRHNETTVYSYRNIRLLAQVKSVPESVGFLCQYDREACDELMAYWESNSAK